MENNENEIYGAQPEDTQSQQPVEAQPVQPQEPAEAQPVQAQQEQPYRNVGAGRKESPFADSPYVMNHQNEEYRQSAYSNYQPSGYQSGYQQNYYAPQQEPKPKKEKKAKKKGAGKVWKGVLAAVLALVVVTGSCGITAVCVNNYWEEKTAAMTDSFNEKIQDVVEEVESISAGSISGGSSAGAVHTSSSQLTPAQVYANNVNAVVLIESTVVSSYYGQTATGVSTGSGFIISSDGYVCTNYHVVEGATDLAVITADSTEYEATLVGYDETNDVAVLKVEGENLPYVTIGSSDDLVVGDQVVAIGNPLGELTSTQTVGYVSAKDRDVTTEGTAINMIQTDAAINSGNSGGPLFNMYGEVVGITTAKYSGTTSSGASIEGIGFAIPIDDVIGMIEDLTQYGYITGAYLGVMVKDMDSDVASAYGLPVGAYILEVTDGYCAQAVGLQAKDIIVDLGGNEIGSISDLTRALRKFEAGDTTTITVYRGGSEKTFNITLDEKPQDTTVTQTVPESTEGMPSEGDFEEWYSYL